ncbi:protein phosphatase 2C domain-containing protein [Candidatus Filomicrobium marinum]|uniref:protein phosphatase 2C domain-containing protein n=1 Tax=Candidatus Filomicrobium marinum TaxID=1608628 RepID=UPI000626EAAD|nr:protein phosphatase 2C domain-containing protein [Candidatus Filomicrobium marinum]
MLAGLSARYAISLSENDFWTFLTVTAVGTNHTSAGTSSEDGIHLTVHNGAVIAVLSDGVSDQKASRSGEGARLAVQHTARAIARGLDVGLDPEQAIVEAFSFTHNTLIQRTTEENAFWGTYACTLAAAVIQGQAITVGHIGDSNAYSYDGKRLTRVATALSNDQPNLIVLPNWRTQFAAQTINKPYIKAFVLATDGTDSFFLGKSEDDGRLTNPEVTHALHTIATTAADHFKVLHVVNALMKHNGYDHHDDRTMFWAFRKEASP